MSPRETCQPHIAGLLADDRQMHKTVRTRIVLTMLQDIWYPSLQIQNMVLTISECTKCWEFWICHHEQVSVSYLTKNSQVFNCQKNFLKQCFVFYAYSGFQIHLRILLFYVMSTIYCIPILQWYMSRHILKYCLLHIQSSDIQKYSIFEAV